MKCVIKLKDRSIELDVSKREYKALNKWFKSKDESAHIIKEHKLERADIEEIDGYSNYKLRAFAESLYVLPENDSKWTTTFIIITFYTIIVILESLSKGKVAVIRAYMPLAVPITSSLATLLIAIFVRQEYKAKKNSVAYIEKEGRYSWVITMLFLLIICIFIYTLNKA